MSLLSMLDNVKHAVTSPFESTAKPQAQATGVNAMDASNPTGGGATSPTDSATITANDFLTLLVTEIQNQDPTTQTDPMQYITQLVGVNSLEQLVQINQTLTGSTGATTPAANAASSPATAAKPNVAVSSAASVKNLQPLASAGQSLPLGSNTQIPPAAETAVANAFTHASALPTQALPGQVLPPTQVPMSPEVMRALEHSIPGATFSGQVPAGIGGAAR